MTTKRCWWLHKWGNWTGEQRQPIGYKRIQIYKLRMCTKCGRVDRKVIKNVTNILS